MQNNLQQQLESSNASLIELQNQAPAQGGEDSEQLVKLKQELATTQQALEVLQSASNAGDDTAPAAAALENSEQTKSIS